MTFKLSYYLIGVKSPFVSSDECLILQETLSTTYHQQHSLQHCWQRMPSQFLHLTLDAIRCLKPGTRTMTSFGPDGTVLLKCHVNDAA